MINLKKQFFTVILLLSLFTVYSQTASSADSDNLITLKFSGYSVDADKLIQKEFFKRDGFRTVYTCIPAGIVIIESEKTVTTVEKDKVSSKINSLKTALNYEFLEGMVLADAEKNCAAKRVIEK